jgi:hypothetical protein
MSSVNLLGTGISIDQALVLASILKVHAILKSLCGNNGDEMELDMSGKNISAAEATMLAAEIAGNGALSFLNLANNSLMRGKMKPSDGSSAERWAKQDSSYETDVSGIVALANAIPDMGALTQLDVSSNNLDGKTMNCSTVLSTGQYDYDYDFSGIQALANALPKCL